MQKSLSFCLPVHNEQATLATTVAEILEVLPELARQFELIIVDDGSTDATPEVAHDLAAHYPQVRLVRHGVRRGTEAAILRGLEETKGDVIVLREEDCGFGMRDVLRIWQRIEPSAARLPTPPRRANESVHTWIQRAKQWGQKRKQQPASNETSTSSGLPELLRRSIGQRWRWAERPALVACLALEHYGDDAAPPRIVRGDELLDRQMPRRTDLASAFGTSVRKPNYLGKLKEFALGE